MEKYINTKDLIVIGLDNPDCEHQLKFVPWEFIEDLPGEDVEKVRHGKWEHGREVHREYIGDALLSICYDKWWCSQCHYTIDDNHYSKITYKRCPECGAHMDKEKEE